MNWKQIGDSFHISQKSARQEFEKLRSAVSQPPHLEQIFERIDDLISRGLMDRKGIEKVVVFEFNIT